MVVDDPSVLFSQCAFSNSNYGFRSGRLYGIDHFLNRRNRKRRIASQGEADLPSWIFKRPDLGSLNLCCAALILHITRIMHRHTSILATSGDKGDGPRIALLATSRYF